MYIENINSPADVKKLNIMQLNVLAEEMRHALLTRASKHGGHFGPNFGMVEAIIAMHYVFDSPKDKIVFDVSHQCYPHKMLTGRKDAYLYEEHYDDVSGYTNPDESEHDFFTVGHTSTSISLACGLAKARDLNGEDGNVIAVIGDGSLSGGEALEGLDFASELNGNMIIVANDNDMSIAENHGGLYANLKLLRETNGQAECNLFKAMNLDYIYVDKGNDIASLIEAFEKVKDTKKAVVVHINTLKGKGYAPAEQNKEIWHWHSPFDIATGESLSKGGEPDFSDASLEYLLKKMADDKSVVALTSRNSVCMNHIVQIIEPVTLFTIVPVDRSVQLQHFLTACHLMQAVNVLRDHCLHMAFSFQLRQPDVCSIRLRICKDHLILIEFKKLFRMASIVAVADNLLRRILVFLIIQSIHTSEIRDTAFR